MGLPGIRLLYNLTGEGFSDKLAVTLEVVDAHLKRVATGLGKYPFQCLGFTFYPLKCGLLLPVATIGGTSSITCTPDASSW